MRGLTPEQLLLLIAGIPILIASLVAWMTHRVPAASSYAEAEAPLDPERSGSSLRPMAERPIDDTHPVRAQEPQSSN